MYSDDYNIKHTSVSLSKSIKIITFTKSIPITCINTEKHLSIDFTITTKQGMRLTVVTTAIV